MPVAKVSLCTFYFPSHFSVFLPHQLLLPSLALVLSFQPPHLYSSMSHFFLLLATHALHPSLIVISSTPPLSLESSSAFTTHILCIQLLCRATNKQCSHKNSLTALVCNFLFPAPHPPTQTFSSPSIPIMPRFFPLFPSFVPLH